MFPRPLLIGALALAGLAVPTRGAPPAPPPVPAPVLLRYKFAPGQTRSYRLTMDMAVSLAPPGKQALPVALVTHTVADVEQTVQSVGPDGAATLQVRLRAMRSTVNGRPSRAPAALRGLSRGVYTLVMSPTGQVLSVKAPGGIGGLLPGLDLSSVSAQTLPERPVRVGETWRGQTDLSQLFTRAAPKTPSPGATVQTLTTLAALEPGALPIADLRQRTGGPIDLDVTTGGPGRRKGHPVRMRGSYAGVSRTRFDVGDGSLADSNGTAALAATVSMPSLLPKLGGTLTVMHETMRLTFRTQRLPDARPAPAPRPGKRLSPG